MTYIIRESTTSIPLYSPLILSMVFTISYISNNIERLIPPSNISDSEL